MAEPPLVVDNGTGVRIHRPRLYSYEAHPPVLVRQSRLCWFQLP